MTYEEAINLLRGLEQSLDGYCELNDEGKKAFNMAVSALELFGNSEQLPSAQPEPCEDAVSREAVSSWLKQYGQDVLHGKYKLSLMYIWKNLMDLPPAQSEPLLDEIVDEIRKTIAETESNGKYHAYPVRHNGEMICHGLEIALDIIEEKRNERFD